MNAINVKGMDTWNGMTRESIEKAHAPMFDFLRDILERCNDHDEDRTYWSIKFVFGRDDDGSPVINTYIMMPEVSVDVLESATMAFVEMLHSFPAVERCYLTSVEGREPNRGTISNGITFAYDLSSHQ